MDIPVTKSINAPNRLTYSTSQIVTPMISSKRMFRSFPDLRLEKSVDVLSMKRQKERASDRYIVPGNNDNDAGPTIGTPPGPGTCGENTKEAFYYIDQALERNPAMNLHVRYIRGMQVEEIVCVHTHSVVQAPRDHSRQTNHKVTNIHSLAFNMDLPHDMEDWEVPVSEIRDWTYTLGSPLIATSQIDLFGFGNVTAFRSRAMENPLSQREAMMLAYEGEVLNWRAHWGQNNHVAVTEHVTAWRSAITVAQSHVSPVHPFDSQKRLLAILNRLYVPHKAPDGAPTLDTSEYDQRFLLTFLGKPRYDDKKASKEQNIRWHRMRQDPHHKPKYWADSDFLHSKRDDETQHHHPSRDEPANSIYVNVTGRPIGVDDDDAKPTVSSASAPPPAPAIPSGLPHAVSFISRLDCIPNKLV
ncbi:hypothetical protein EDD85DRAFT_983313 [Armillaria nabsnona]|nr:hypothetical protein EDD85DRAFT_983313 [Armillaria nabsnona]